ncbi:MULTISPECIES: hypothetical protein [Campylobacter]|uniref:hypothetical protein n=1 Tax=Campylobacter TaxID=194 RepID=UPI000DCEA95D|nr:hypothetical protein [Campylobacter hyointestinalis]MEE3776487.1 hypothetical protein [Campylobacter sp. CX2-4080-23]RAZ59609.1 hypothetical protein CHL10071_08935 [Campylobacter hyointestinalis subsp. lawsonii]
MKKIVLLLLFVAFSFSSDISSPNGRYEFKQISEARRDQFLIDTQTGKVWRMIFVPFDKKDTTQENGFNALEPMYFYDGSAMPDPIGVKNANGRYKLDQISSARRDQFLLDTLTGRVWRVVATKDETNIFEPVFFTNQTFTPDGKK